MSKTIRLVFFLMIIANNLPAQSQYVLQDSIFGPPLQMKLLLIGNFGELRPRHFHAGLDFRTNYVTGKKITAIADGYVSRIIVSPWGYGKGLYINHPGGYKSVYGHLLQFNDTIEQCVRKLQYKTRQFALNYYPPPDMFPVKKGEIIALSGNTGSSQGPHLHFEIRKTATDCPVNGLFFGFDIEDNTPPKIYRIAIYPLNERSFVNAQNQKAVYETREYYGSYRIYSQNTIKVYGDIGFGIETEDFVDATTNHGGVYSIALHIDGELWYYHQLDSVPFNKTRYINSHVDYEERVKERRWIQKCFVQPNNKLSIYKNLKNSGVFHFNDSNRHHIELFVKDVYGNMESIDFDVKSEPPPKKTGNENPGKKTKLVMPFQKSNYFYTDDLHIIIPKNALYDTLFFEYKKQKAPQYDLYFSDIHNVHNPYTPLHKPITVEIRADSMPEHLQSKALIASKGRRGHIYSLGGEWHHGFVKTQTYYFNDYFVTVDTIPPTIEPVNFVNNQNLSYQQTIECKISDDLSGIDRYQAYIDGQWVLFEYDGKNNLISYRFDEHVLVGQKHYLLINVWDRKNNKTVYEAMFYK